MTDPLQAFHPTGRYLLTGGFDNTINCWVIPDLPTADAGSDHVVTIHYPHFSTMAVHTDFVDWYVGSMITLILRQVPIRILPPCV